MGERPWEGFAKAETMSKAGRKKKKMEGKAMNTMGGMPSVMIKGVLWIRWCVQLFIGEKDGRPCS